MAPPSGGSTNHIEKRMHRRLHQSNVHKLVTRIHGSVRSVSKSRRRVDAPVSACYLETHRFKMAPPSAWSMNHTEQRMHRRLHQSNVHSFVTRTHGSVRIVSKSRRRVDAPVSACYLDVTRRFNTRIRSFVDNTIWSRDLVPMWNAVRWPN